MPDPRDHELEQYLTGQSELSRLYRKTARETSPPALDEKILRAARRELRSRRARWMKPLSVAAVLVLAFSLLLRVQHEDISPLPTDPEAPPADARTFEAMPAGETDDAAAVQRPAAPVQAPAPASEKTREAQQPDAARSRQAVPLTAPMVESSPDEWIAHIRELRAAGHDEAARAQLTEFQARYPDYPLPEDLLGSE